jgi:hypothetical protein
MTNTDVVIACMDLVGRCGASGDRRKLKRQR